MEEEVVVAEAVVEEVAAPAEEVATEVVEETESI